MRLTRQLPIRLTDEQRKSLEKIGEQNYQTPTNLVRIAVDQLLDYAARNDGALPIRKNPACEGSHLVDTEMGLQARKCVDSEAAADRELSDPGELEGKPKSNEARKK